MESWVSFCFDRLGFKVEPGRRSRLVAQLLAFLTTLLGTVGTQAGTYLAMVLIARFLGVESFGRYGVIQATLAAAIGLSSLGLGVTSTRFIAKFRVTDPERTGRIIALCNLAAMSSGLLFSAILFVSADLLALRLFHSSELASPIRVSSLCSLFLTVNANQSGTLVGFQAFGRLLRAQLLQSTLTVGLTYILVSQYQFAGAILSLPISALAGCLLLNREIRIEMRSHGIAADYRECWTERQVLAEFALPAATSGMIGSAAVWSAQLILVRTESGLAEIGLWTAAVSMRAAVLLGPGVLARVSSPFLSALHDHGRGEDYGKTMWSTAFAATGGAVAAGLLVLLCGPWLVILFGKDYARAAGLIPLVIGSAIVEAYAGSVSQALVAHRRLDYQLGVISLWALTLITLTWWSTEAHAASGLAFAYLMAWVSTAISYTWIARKLIAARGAGKLSTAESLHVLEA